MKKSDAGWIALGIEAAAFLWKKGVEKHPLSCTCGTCLAIDVSIPVTLGVTLSFNGDKE